MVGDKDNSPESLNNFSLIDFGLCTEYLDKEGNHIIYESKSKFYGNVAFASKHAMNFKSVSRRDDLISLTYLLLYLLLGNLGFLDPSCKIKKEKFAFIA